MVIEAGGSYVVTRIYRIFFAAFEMLKTKCFACSEGELLHIAKEFEGFVDDAVCHLDGYFVVVTNKFHDRRPRPNGVLFAWFVLLKQQHHSLVAVETSFFFFVKFAFTSVVVTKLLEFVFVGFDADYVHF